MGLTSGGGLMLRGLAAGLALGAGLTMGVGLAAGEVLAATKSARVKVAKTIVRVFVDLIGDPFLDGADRFILIFGFRKSARRECQTLKHGFKDFLLKYFEPVL
jgi:hypothetical protein